METKEKQEREKKSDIKKYTEEMKDEIINALTKKPEIRYGTIKDDLKLLFGIK